MFLVWSRRDSLLQWRNRLSNRLYGDDAIAPSSSLQGSFWHRPLGKRNLLVLVKTTPLIFPTLSYALVYHALSLRYPWFAMLLPTIKAHATLTAEIGITPFHRKMRLLNERCRAPFHYYSPLWWIYFDYNFYNTKKAIWDLLIYRGNKIKKLRQEWSLPQSDK